MTTRRRKFEPAPRQFKVVRPLLMLLVSALAVGVPTWIAAGLVGGQYLEPKQTYAGNLRASQSPSAVTLPEGVVLGEILVARGDEVRAGQTVATIDQQAVRAAKDRLENETAALVLERRCLLDPTVFAGMEPAAFDALDEMEQLIGIALRSCRAIAQESQSQSIEIEEDHLRLLEARQSLLDQQSGLISRQSMVPGQPFDDAFLIAALQVQLEINATRLEEVRHQRELEDLRAEIENAELSRLRQLSNMIAENSKVLERLDRALKSPRLQAPSDGRVQRVRTMRSGSFIDRPTDLMEIVQSDTGVFEVEFRASLDPHFRFDIGQILDVTPLDGSDLFAERLTAEIIEITHDANSSSENELQIRLYVSGESEELIAQSRSSLALIGPETAARVIVRLPNQLAQTSVMNVLHRNCALLGHWTCSDNYERASSSQEGI